MNLPTDLEALHCSRWIFVTLKTDLPAVDFFHADLIPFLKKQTKSKYIEDVIITNEGQFVLLFIKTTAYHSSTTLKPQLHKLYGDSIINYNDFYLLNFVIPNTHFIAEKLLPAIYPLLENHIAKNAPNYDLDEAFSFFVTLHLVFIHAMGMSKKEVQEFYHYAFTHALQSVSEDPLEQKVLNEQLSLFFDDQKAFFIPFVTSLVESLDASEWHEYAEWHACSKSAFESIVQLQATNNYIVPAEYLYDKALLSNDALQQRWILLEQYILFIDAQFIDRYMLYYFIKESIYTTTS